MFSNKVKTDESGISPPAQNLHCELDDNDDDEDMIYMKSFIQNDGHLSESEIFGLLESSDDIFVMTPDVGELTESTSSSSENFQESVISRKQGLKATAVSKMQLSDEYPMTSTDNVLKEILQTVNSLDTSIQKQQRVLVEQKEIWSERWSGTTAVFKRHQDIVSNIKDTVERISDYIDHNDRVDGQYVMSNQILEKVYTEVCGIHGKVTETRDLCHSFATEVKKISDHVSSNDRQIKAMHDLIASTLNRMETVDKCNRNDSRPCSQPLVENYEHLPVVSPSHSSQGYNKPIMSLPVSAYRPHNRNTGSASLNNSFQCLNSSDHKEKTDDFFDDIHFITKRKYRDLIFPKKSYTSDCISKKNGPVNQRTLHPLDMNVDITGQKHIYQSSSKTDDSMQVPDSQKFQIAGKINDDTAPKLDTDPKRIKLEMEIPEFPLTARIRSQKKKTSKNAVLPPNSKEKSHGNGYSIPPAPNSKKVYKLRSERNSICANKKPKESSSKAALSNSAKISPMTDDDSNDCMFLCEVKNNVSFNSRTNAGKVPLSKGKIGGVKPDTIPLMDKKKPEEYSTKRLVKNIKVENLNPAGNDSDTGNVFQMQDD